MEENVFVSWKTHDKIEKDQKVDWFWAVAIIGIVGAVLAFLFGNFLFGVFILLSIIILMFFATQKPKEISCEINEKGLVIEKQLIPYSKMISFWLEESIEPHKLLIHTTHSISPILDVYYESKEIGDEIYEALIERIEEKPLVEPISQQIFEKLGF